MDPATILALITAAAKVIDFGTKWFEDRKRNRELTPEEEAAWDAFVKDRMTQSHWKKSTE